MDGGGQGGQNGGDGRSCKVTGSLLNDLRNFFAGLNGPTGDYGFTKRELRKQEEQSAQTAQQIAREKDEREKQEAADHDIVVRLQDDLGARFESGVSIPAELDRLLFLWEKAHKGYQSDITGPEREELGRLLAKHRR